MISYGILSFSFWLHLVWKSLVSSILLQMALFCFLWWVVLCYIYIHIYLYMCIYIHEDVIYISHFFFLGPHLWHMEFPGPGVESQPQLPAYTTDIAIPDPSHICDLHSRLWQCWILNLLSKARDQTCIFMDTSQVLTCWATVGIPMYHIFLIHSSVSGLLGCFHILAIVNSATMNIQVHVSFWIVV